VWLNWIQLGCNEFIELGGFDWMTHYERTVGAMCKCNLGAKVIKEVTNKAILDLVANLVGAT
jgi:hypothetical protein